MKATRQLTMLLDDTSAIIPPVLAKARTPLSLSSVSRIAKPVAEAWLKDRKELNRLLDLGLQLTDATCGYAAIHAGQKLLVGAQVGTKLNSSFVEKSFLEELWKRGQPVEFLHFDAEALVRFRQNNLLLDQPSISSVYVFAIRNAQNVPIGCLVLASVAPMTLDERQLGSCQVLARQLSMQLKFYRKVEALKTSQKQLLQINTELRRFASVAAHDLRSPLRAMGSFAGLLRRRLKHKLNPEELEYVDHIRSGASRLSAMVEGILNLAKANHEDYSKYENIDLPTLVAEVADLIDPDQHHIIDFKGDQRRIKSSLPAVKQVLMNLVSNAVKYHHLPAGEIIVSASSDEQVYTITVSDNGPGIAADDQERIFEAFVTGNEAPRVPGTGLGLALVRSLANRLGGTLKLESTLGQGSTFEVKIPTKVH